MSDDDQDNEPVENAPIARLDTVKQQYSSLTDLRQTITKSMQRSPSEPDIPTIRHCDARRSAVLPVKYNNTTINVLIDGGAELNLKRLDLARSLCMQIHPATQRIMQADGTTLLRVVGEAHVTLQLDHLKFTLDALVIRCMNEPLLTGMPFLEDNAVKQDYDASSLTFRDGTTMCCKQSRAPPLPICRNVKVS